MPLLPSLGALPWLVISANLLAAVFLSITLWLAFKLGREDGTPHLNLLFCLMGAILGWATGILASPLDTSDAARFVTLGQAASAFLSGYVVSKLDRFLERTLFTADDVRPFAWRRLGLMTSAFLVLFIAVFLNRTYFHSKALPQPGASAPSSAVAPQPGTAPTDSLGRRP